jgi:hypothetical protein
MTRPLSSNDGISRESVVVREIYPESLLINHYLRFSIVNSVLGSALSIAMGYL